VTAAGDVTTEELSARLGEAGLVLLDVRSAAEYEGSLGAPCDPRQGHIPGARLLELSDLLGLSAELLRSAVGAEEGAEVIAYCHSGSRSQVAVAALRAVGFQARNYVGSWHAWSRDPSLPAETGR
jgi:thiosulfate/3-mercaptopyruvate sulfurtransferase